jgi:hypothetical protein
MNTVNSGNAQTMNMGDSILTIVRKINKDRKDPSKGFNFQIEVREKVAETSLLALFNPTDDRIIKPKAQPAWAMIEPETFKQLFNIDDATFERVNNLPVSTGVKELKENVHFVTLNILNPTVNGNRLRVQITESTEKSSEDQKSKVNPATGVVLTHQGKPIYRTTTIVLYNPKPFAPLAADKVELPLEVVGAAPAMTPNVAAAAAR